MKCILAYRKLLAGLIIAITLFFMVGLGRISMDYNFDSFFAKNDTSYIKFKQWSKEFKVNQHCLINVAFERDESVYQKSFLQKADSVFNRIARIKGISKSYFFTNLEDNKRTLFGIKKVPLVSFKTDEQVRETKKKQQKNKWLFDSFISNDEKSICGFFYIEPDLFNLPKRDSICNSMESVLKKSKLNYHLYGMPYVRTVFSKKIVNDFFSFTFISTTLLLLSLFYIFRNRYLIAAPFLSVIVGAIWTFGLMGWCGHPINMITNMLIPILFVVGVSDSIHIINAFLGGIKEQLTPDKAIQNALKEVGVSTSLTAIVSAVGFLSLAITDIPAIKIFGLYGFFGIASTFIVSVVLIPNILMFCSPKKIRNKKAIINSEQWRPFFRKIYVGGFRFQKLTIVVSSMILLLSLFFASKIPTSLHFLDDVNKNDKLWHSLNFFEKKFSGFKPFELVVETIDGSKVVDQKNLNELYRLQNFLASTNQFSDFISIVNMVKYENYVFEYGKQNSYVLPNRQERIDFLLNYVTANNEIGILSVDKKSTMISAKMLDIGSEETKKLEDRVRQYLAQKSSNLTITFTGFGHVLDKSNDTLRSDLLVSIFIDLLMISSIMAFLFRSFSYVLISIIPNIFPLIITAGVMGLLKIPLSPSNTIVFVIIFGISIDDTIHFLTHYLLLRKKSTIALWKTLDSTGKAMTIVSLILMAGVGSLCFSDFGAIFSVGLFALITIFFATLSEFFITPILIRVFDKQLV